MIGAIAAAGFLGAAARYALGLAWPTGGGASFPWTTLFINLSGSLLLGLLLGYAGRMRIPEWCKEAAGTGFLGAYTTFGAFNTELLELVQHDAFASAVAYAFASAAVGWLLARAGLRLGSGGGLSS